MKKWACILLAVVSISMSGCDTVKSIAGSFLSEAEAARGIREALLKGVDNGTFLLGQKGAFGQETLLNAILPENLQKVVQVLNQLGLTNELNRFTATIDNAATQTVTRSAPVFINGIKQMSIRDAISIVKNGGTSATDYLRRTVGDSLRTAITPVMKSALDEYKITQEWDKLIGPAKILLGSNSRLNLGIDNILAMLITNEMFKRIEQQEVAIRTTAAARTTPLLERVFGKDWSATPAKY